MIILILVNIIVMVSASVLHISVFSAGLVRYSTIPRTQWQLNTHQTKKSLLKAINKLQQRGGHTNTGDLTARCLTVMIVIIVILL